MLTKVFLYVTICQKRGVIIIKQYTLFIDNPAYEWENATPVGCGNLGAMLYGTVASEKLQLNEEKIWSGDCIEAVSEGFRDKLDTVRKLLLEGKAYEANEWAKEHLNDDFHRVKSYETAGDLIIKLHDDDECEYYRRELNLNEGIATVTYTKDGVNYKRELFASYPAKLIALKISSDKPNALNPFIGYERENLISMENKGDITSITGKTAFGDHKFTVKIKTAVSEYAYIYYIVINSDFPENLEWDALLTEHISDFKPIMERSDITLCQPDAELEAMPVHARLARIREGNDDLGLIQLYFQFGKYLLVGSSRNGTLPANLQGVWSGYIEAPWNADYHTNINLQMNYWHVESANLGECIQPLFDYINDNLLESGKHTAEVNYKCRGAVLHHLSDIYKFTAPADGLWGLWPLGGAWLCYHMWEHYLYTLDKDFLKNTAYNYIHECSRFFLDYMVEDKDGKLLSGPSTSPENRYFADGKECYLCMSPTMDVEIIGGLLRFYIEVEQLLGLDLAQADEAAEALKKMPELKVGKHGQLMEWLEDYDEPEPGHRHISHMFALYPDCAVNETTTELFKAAETTLKRRLSHGGGHTGWSCAWLVLLFARLQNGTDAYKTLTKLLTQSTKDNLFDSHPPFQIDGNFGGSAGIIEMLMQSHNGLISILPAVPECYSTGSFEKLMARGGVSVDAEWIDGTVTKVVLKASNDYSFKLKMNGASRDMSLKAGETLTISK